MDGARLANAVASLTVAPKEITWQSGMDGLCFGGTKNGTPVGDAVADARAEDLPSTTYDSYLQESGESGGSSKTETEPPASP